MRSVVLDTETTGLSARLGDRIIEIGCVEILNRRVTERHWHQYVNPERKSEAGALAVHGISDEFLEDKPRFVELAADFLEFIRGAELIIHNAPFDVEFLDAELKQAGLDKLDRHDVTVIDTLRLAKELHPGKRNSLDALCERYQIDHSHRTLHGALLDARLLAEVYLVMTRGQDSLAIELDSPRAAGAVAAPGTVAGERPRLRVVQASAEELAAHARLLAEIEAESKGRCVWNRVEPASEARKPG
ncbi:MAG: DNA polymerase III subunit epsilon [Burkholderiales bacterium]